MSQYWDILTAVKGVIEGVLSGTLVKVRKRPLFSPDHGDVLPMVCLSVTHEDIAERQMPNGQWVDYPVELTYYQTHGSTIADPAALQLQLGARETLRLALCKPSLSDVSTVISYKYDPAPVFDLGGLDDAYDVSCQLFTYRNNETRSA